MCMQGRGEGPGTACDSVTACHVHTGAQRVSSYVMTGHTIMTLCTQEHSVTIEVRDNVMSNKFFRKALPVRVLERPHAVEFDSWAAEEQNNNNANTTLYLQKPPV